MSSPSHAFCTLASNSSRWDVEEFQRLAVRAFGLKTALNDANWPP